MGKPCPAPDGVPWACQGVAGPSWPLDLPRSLVLAPSSWEDAWLPLSTLLGTLQLAHTLQGHVTPSHLPAEDPTMPSPPSHGCSKQLPPGCFVSLSQNHCGLSLITLRSTWSGWRVGALLALFLAPCVCLFLPLHSPGLGEKWPQTARLGRTCDTYQRSQAWRSEATGCLRMTCRKGYRVASFGDRRCANQTHVWPGIAATLFLLGTRCHRGSIPNGELPLCPANVGRGAPSRALRQLGKQIRGVPCTLPWAHSAKCLSVGARFAAGGGDRCGTVMPPRCSL